jgi:hypothetical protein
MSQRQPQNRRIKLAAELRQALQVAALKGADRTANAATPICSVMTLLWRPCFPVALLSGMRLEDVSTILGHSSVRVTEKHSMPWVRARQASLNQSVKQSWLKQGIVPLPKPRSRPHNSARGSTARRGRRLTITSNCRVRASTGGCAEQCSPLCGICVGDHSRNVTGLVY